MATAPWTSGNPWDRDPPILTLQLNFNDSSRTHDHGPPPFRRPPACLTPPTNGRTWLLPATTHSTGANGAFYTTNVAAANVCVAPASFTMTFPGHDQDGSAGPKQTFHLKSQKSVAYFDVLGSVFSQNSTLSGPFTGARLVPSSSTLGAAITGFASAVDQATNDPTAVEAR